MPIQFPTDFEDAGLKALVDAVVLDNKVTDNADKKYNYINGSNFFRFNPTTHDEQVWYIGKIQSIINTIVNEDMGNLWQRAEIERRIAIALLVDVTNSISGLRKLGSDSVWTRTVVAYLSKKGCRLEGI